MVQGMTSEGAGAGDGFIASAVVEEVKDTVEGAGAGEEVGAGEVTGEGDVDGEGDV